MPTIDLSFTQFKRAVSDAVLSDLSSYEVEQLVLAILKEYRHFSDASFSKIKAFVDKAHDKHMRDLNHDYDVHIHYDNHLSGDYE